MAEIRILPHIKPWMAVAGVRELSQPSMESSMGTPAKRSIPETIWGHHLDGEKEGHRQQHFMLGKAMADGQRRVKLQAGDHTEHQKEEQALHQEGHAVAHIVGVPLVRNLLEDPTQLPEHLHIRHQGQQGQDIHHNRPQEPDGGDNQL